MSKWSPQDIPSQAGKRALITGANSGIGFHTARYLAGVGCHVMLGCRDPRRGEEALQKIQHEFPSSTAELAILDLASLRSIHSLAEDFLKGGQPLDMLINNAGVMGLPTRETTEDGFERQFGVNHLGHFALTGLLLPAVLAASAGRVVTVASIAHKGNTRMRFDDLQFTTGYKPTPPYRQSKLANLLFGFELQRRLERATAAAISVVAHPGLSDTKIVMNGPGKGRSLVSTFGPLTMKILAQSDERGSFPTLYAATSPQALGGRYYGPDGFREMWGAPVEVKPEPQATNLADAARLWDISEGLTGVRYSAIEAS